MPTMPATQDTENDDRDATFGGVIYAIMAISICSGIVSSLVITTPVALFAWFWVGFAVSVLYLLTKIANSVYQQ